MSCAAHVSVGYSRISGFVQIRVLVLDHPARVVQQRCTPVGVLAIESPELDLVVQIPRQRLQEHGVGPAPLGIEQVQPLDVVGRVNAAANELFGLRRGRSRSCVRRCPSSSARIEWPAPRPGPWKSANTSGWPAPCCCALNQRRTVRRPSSICDDPGGQVDRRLARLRISGQQPVQAQAGGVVVLVGRAAAADARVPAGTSDAASGPPSRNAPCARTARGCRRSCRDRCGRCRCR